MKIISGEFKGRTIKGFDIVGTRPTMDRVKESLFAIIQNYIPNSVVLDLFAGSGNLGIEALSNGAKYCYFNDINKKCTRYIESVIDELKIKGKSNVSNNHYSKALKQYLENNVKFDIVFLDPPYKLEILNDIIKTIKDYKLLNQNGLIICEVDSLYLQVDCYDKIKEKKYGSKYIIIYKNIL